MHLFRPMTKPDLSCLTELTDEEYEAAPSLSREAIQTAFSKFRAALACGYRRNATRGQRKASEKAKAPDGVCYTPSEPLPVCRSHSLLFCSTSSESHIAIGRLMSRRLVMYLSGTPFDGVDYTKELSIDGLSSFIDSVSHHFWLVHAGVVRTPYYASSGDKAWAFCTVNSSGKAEIGSYEPTPTRAVLRWLVDEYKRSQDDVKHAAKAADSRHHSSVALVGILLKLSGNR